jgi:hypothetical protein
MTLVHRLQTNSYETETWLKKVRTKDKLSYLSGTQNDIDLTETQYTRIISSGYRDSLNSAIEEIFTIRNKYKITQWNETIFCAFCSPMLCLNTLQSIGKTIEMFAYHKSTVSLVPISSNFTCMYKISILIIK